MNKRTIKQIISCISLVLIPLVLNLSEGLNPGLLGILTAIFLWSSREQVELFENKLKQKAYRPYGFLLVAYPVVIVILLIFSIKTGIIPEQMLTAETYIKLASQLIVLPLIFIYLTATVLGACIIDSKYKSKNGIGE